MFASGRSYTPSSYAALQQSKAVRPSGRPATKIPPSPSIPSSAPQHNPPSRPIRTRSRSPSTYVESDEAPRLQRPNTSRRRTGAVPDTEESRSSESSRREDTRDRRPSLGSDKSSTILGGARSEECCFCLKSVRHVTLRYRCRDCQDVFLCESCVVNAAIAHPGHSFAAAREETVIASPKTPHPSTQTSKTSSKRATHKRPSHRSLSKRGRSVITCCFCKRRITGTRFECQNCPGTISLHEQCLRLHPSHHVMEIFTVDGESLQDMRENEDAASSPNAEGSGLRRSRQDDSACNEQDKDSGQEEDSRPEKDSGDQQCESQLGNDGLIDNGLGPQNDAGTTSGSQNSRNDDTHVDPQTSISLRPDPSCVTLTLSTDQFAELAQTLGRRVEEATVATVSTGLMRRIEDALVTNFVPVIQRMVEEATAKAISGRNGTKRKRPGKHSGRYENEDDEDEIDPDEADEDDDDKEGSDGDGDVNESVFDTLDFTLDTDLDAGNINQRRLWGRQDCKRLRELKEKGWSDRSIGNTLNRTPSAVTQQWWKMRQGAPQGPKRAARHRRTSHG